MASLLLRLVNASKLESVCKCEFAEEGCFTETEEDKGQQVCFKMNGTDSLNFLAKLFFCFHVKLEMA